MRRTRSVKQALGAVLVAVWMSLSGAPPVAAQSSKVPIAVFTPGMTFGPVFNGLKEELDRQGYREGREVTFIVVNTNGDNHDLTPRMTNLLESKPGLLLTVSTPHTRSARQATNTIPIVFAFVSDPVGSGLVAGYASSQNNVTGVSSSSAVLTGKRLEILREVSPRIKRILVIVAVNESFTLNSFRNLDDAATKLGIQLVHRDVTSKEEIEQALRTTPKGSVDAIFYIPSFLVRAHINLLITKAREDRIPLDVNDDSLVELGGLISYGPESRLLGVQAAKMVVKILKGARPSEIPVENPEKLFLTISLATAKAIGLKVPRSLLDRADRLVE